MSESDDSATSEKTAAQSLADTITNAYANDQRPATKSDIAFLLSQFVLTTELCRSLLELDISSHDEWPEKVKKIIELNDYLTSSTVDAIIALNEDESPDE
ncbi:hypothetical protein [Roseivivax sp. THAF197b]|uniref:hypothetical protein n=1 Tax=Roseivivax sp. THAF197b TaxID=2588299 RepID=UPI001268D545|nr:hypothetical protein [Roseivivax sp. THAF197b]